MTFALNPYAIGIDAILHGTLWLAVDIHFYSWSVGRSLVWSLPCELVAALCHKSRSKRHYNMHTLVFLKTEVLVVLILLLLRPHSTSERLDDDTKFFQRALDGLRHTDYGVFFCRDVAHGKLHLQRHRCRRIGLESLEWLITDSKCSSARDTEHFYTVIVLHPSIASARKAVPYRRYLLLCLLVDDGLKIRLGIVAHLRVEVKMGTRYGRIVVLVVYCEHHKSVALTLTKKVDYLVAIISEYAQISLIRGRTFAVRRIFNLNSGVNRITLAHHGLLLRHIVRGRVVQIAIAGIRDADAHRYRVGRRQRRRVGTLRHPHRKVGDNRAHIVLNNALHTLEHEIRLRQLGWSSRCLVDHHKAVDLHFRRQFATHAVIACYPCRDGMHAVRQ